jgi:hypothetical protein
MPVRRANVSSVLYVSFWALGIELGGRILGEDVPGVSGNTTAVDDDTGEDEADDSNDLDRAEDELDFTVATDTKDVDEDDDDKEDGDPHAVADTRVVVVIISSPEADGDTGGDQFEGEDDKPLHGVVPAHGETP